MAPLSTDPHYILVVLNAARRKALYKLACDITAYTRAQWELPRDGAGPAEQKPSQGPETDPLTVGGTLASSRTPSNPSATPETDASVSQRHVPPTSELTELRREALAHFDEWRKGFLTKLKGILSTPDDAKILGERQKRSDEIAQAKADAPAEGEDLMDLGGQLAANGAGSAAHDVARAIDALRAVYHPIPTRLTTIPLADRKEVLSAVLILLLSTGSYSAYSRAFITYLASAFELPISFLASEEKEIAKTMIGALSEAEKAEKAGKMSAEAEAQKRKQENQASRFWKVGLASVAGAAIIGVTGGLAAPVVAGAIGGLMGSVGLGGLASFLGIFWMNGALVGTLFGAFGARMTGEMADKYAREVEDFRFLPLKDEWEPGFSKADKDIRRLRVTIGINGWLTSEDEVTKPWRVLGDETEAFALRYEMQSLLKLGRALEDMVSSYAWSVLKIEILRRTVLATLWAALWPIQILKLAAGIDNPFNLAKNRSEKAGRILADALINKIQGERPVTLVGYSLGARVIYFCLKTLAERKAFGLVDTVVLIGAPAPSNRTHWQTMSSVVAGKMFNVFSENDYILAFLYRATSIQLGVAGLQEVKDIEGVENLNLSEEVKGHLRYPGIIAQILTRCGFPDIKGGQGPIEKEEIKLEDTDGFSREGILVELDDGPAPTVTPVRVRPLGKKVRREISFPSGISRNEERPLVRKVQSVPVSADSKLRTTVPILENSEGSSKQNTVTEHRLSSQGSSDPESPQEPSKEEDMAHGPAGLRSSLPVVKSSEGSAKEEILVRDTGGFRESEDGLAVLEPAPMEWQA